MTRFRGSYTLNFVLKFPCKNLYSFWGTHVSRESLYIFTRAKIVTPHKLIIFCIKTGFHSWLNERIWFDTKMVARFFLNGVSKNSKRYSCPAKVYPHSARAGIPLYFAHFYRNIIIFSYNNIIFSCLFCEREVDVLHIACAHAHIKFTSRTRNHRCYGKDATEDWPLSEKHGNPGESTTWWKERKTRKVYSISSFPSKKGAKSAAGSTRVN